MHDGLQRANWDALDQALVDRAGRNVARGSDAALHSHGPEPPAVDGTTAWSNTAASTGPPTSRSGMQTSSTRDASVGSRSSAGDAARSASGKSAHSHVHTRTAGAVQSRSSAAGDPPHHSLSSGASLRSFPSGGFGLGLPPAGYISLADPSPAQPGFPPQGPGSVFSHAHAHLMPDAPAAGLAAYGNILPLAGSMGNAYAEAGLDPLASDTRSIRSLGGLSAAIRRHESLVDAATIVGYPSAPGSDRVNTQGVGASAMLVSEDAGSYSQLRTPMMGAGWQSGATLSVADTAPLSQRSTFSAPHHALKTSELPAPPAPVEMQQAAANANRMAFELVAARAGAVFAEPSSARDARPWDDAGSANTWPVPPLTVPPGMHYGPGMNSARKEPWMSGSARGYGLGNPTWTSHLTNAMPSPGYFGMMPSGGGIHAYGQTQTPATFMTPTSEGLGHIMGHPHGPFAWANERAPMTRPGYWVPPPHDAPYQQGAMVPPLNTSALEYGYAMGASARSYEDPAAAMASAHAAGLTFAMNAGVNPTSSVLPVTYVADADLRAMMGRMQPHNSAPGRAAASAPARPRQTTATARGGAAAPAKGGSARSKQLSTGRRGPGRPKGSRTKTSPTTTAAAPAAHARAAAAFSSTGMWGGGDDGDDAGEQPSPGMRVGQIDRKRARAAVDQTVAAGHTHASVAQSDGHGVREEIRPPVRPSAAQAAAALTSDALAAFAHSSNKRARILSEASRSASLGGSTARGMRARKAWVGVSYVARIRKYRSYYFHPFLKKTVGCGSFSSAYEAAKARHRVICELTPETRTHITQDFVPDEDDEDAANLLPADASAGVLAHALAPDSLGPSDGSAHAPIDGGDAPVSAASAPATNVAATRTLEQHGDSSSPPLQQQGEGAEDGCVGNATTLMEASSASPVSQSPTLSPAGNPNGVPSAPVPLAAIAEAESAPADDVVAPT